MAIPVDRKKMKRPHLASPIVVGVGYAGLYMLLRPRDEAPYPSSCLASIKTISWKSRQHATPP